MTNKEVILSVKGISKIFPGVKALDNVDMEIYKGEIHGLVGANGAGKSTLINILSGYIDASFGDLYLNGEKEVFKSPLESIKKGIVTVHQEIDIIKYLTVAQNIFLGNESKFTKYGLINIKRMNNEAKEILKSLELDIDVKSIMDKLSTADQQMIMIAAALAKKAKIMIFDEPTSALSSTEAENLFKNILNLKKNKISIIYISHRLDEVMQLVDRVTIFRDGKVSSTVNISDTNLKDIIEQIIGKRFGKIERNESYFKDDAIISVKNLKTKNNKVNGLSFDLKTQEILGIYGLIGSGRTEMAKAIFMGEGKEEGEILIKGKNVNIKNAHSSIANGVIYCPQDRKNEGLLMELSIVMNICITVMDRFVKNGIINKKRQVTATNEYIKKLSIKVPDVNKEVKYLSGGNQQKIVLSKWLITNSEIMILDEPTIGIDVGAKEEILNIMDQIAAAGKSIIFISSEIEELVKVCDRILVMRLGRIIGEFKRKDFNEHKIIETSVKGGLCQE